MNGNQEDSDQVSLNINQSVFDDLEKAFQLQNLTFGKVEKFGKGDNYLGYIYRAIISGINKDGIEESQKVIVKMSIKHAAVRERIPLKYLYSREIFVYETFLPAIHKYQKDCNVPKSEYFKFARCYASDAKEMKEVLIFEDLNDNNKYTMYDRLKPIDYEHALLVVKNIAKYHALSFAIKDRKPEIYKQAEKYKFDPTDFGDGFEEHLIKCRDNAIHNVDSEHRARFAKFGERIYQELKDSLDVGNDDCPYNVLCHGDCWNNNFLYRYEESKPVEVIMVDWQILRYASPVSDLSYFIYSGTDKAFRDKHLDELYNIYYQTLKNHLGKLDVDVDKCYPEYVFRQQLKSKSITGLIWSFLLLPIILTSRSDAKDLNDFVETENNQSESSIQYYSPYARERFNEVVSEFIEKGII